MNPYELYEAAKRAWIDANPDASPEQYERAMAALAEQYGI